MDVRTRMFVFPRLQGPARKFLTWDVCPNDSRMSAGYPAQDFLFGLFFVPELYLNGTLLDKFQDYNTGHDLAWAS